MSPNETLFLESTNKIIKDDINNSSFVQFQIWDFPGQIDIFDNCFDSDMIFGGCGALVFVIDAQDDYLDALRKLHVFVTKAYKVNPNIKFEVFIHKVDGLGDDSKMECQRDIHQRAMDDLSDSGELIMERIRRHDDVILQNLNWTNCQITSSWRQICSAGLLFIFMSTN